MASAILCVLSDIKPIIGGKTAPPTIAMTINDPPSLVFSPSPLIPNAKMVGNMSDIKKLVRNMDHTPAHPGIKIAISTRVILVTP